MRRHRYVKTVVLPPIDRSVIAPGREGTSAWLELYAPVLWLDEMPLGSRFYGRINMVLDGMVFATAAPIYIAKDGLESLSLLVDRKLADSVLAAERIELVFTGETLEFDPDDTEAYLPMSSNAVRAVFRLVS